MLMLMIMMMFNIDDNDDNNKNIHNNGVDYNDDNDDSDGHQDFVLAYTCVRCVWHKPCLARPATHIVCQSCFACTCKAQLEQAA